MLIEALLLWEQWGQGGGRLYHPSTAFTLPERYHPKQFSSLTLVVRHLSELPRSS